MNDKMKKMWFLGEDGRSPRTLYVMHDHRTCGLHTDFMHGVEQNPIVPQIFNVEDNKWGKVEHVLKWDYLPNSTRIMLANKRALELLSNLCPDDFQAIPTVLKMPDCREIEEYHLINILYKVDSIDHEESILLPERYRTEWSKYDKYYHRRNSIEERHYLAIDDFVFFCSDDFRKAVKEAKLTGLTFKESYGDHYFLPEE